MRYVPWHVKGVRPEVREAARVAARRSGLSVGAWLNSLIIGAAAGSHWRPASPRPRLQPVRMDDAPFAEIRKDIDKLKNQMSRTQLEPAIFERRLHEIEARIDTLQSSAARDDIREVVRQQLDEFRDALKEAPPGEEIAKVWRHDLEKINVTLREAMSTSVIAALEEQVQELGLRLEEHRGTEAATMATADVEQALLGIRDRLKALTPAEELGELINAVKLLSSRVDSIAKGVAPEKIEQLEHAIGALSRLASQVASRDIVAALSSEIKALSDKIDTQSDRWDGADHRMDEVLVQLKELREQNESRLAAIQQQIAASAADAISSPAESIRRDVASLKEIQTSVDRRTQDTFEAVYGTIEQMVDRLDAIENELRDRHFAPHPDGSADEPEWRGEPALLPKPALPPTTPLPNPPPQAGEGREGEWGGLGRGMGEGLHLLRHPAIPGFASDASREPDSGARGVHLVTNAIDRIAASEAASGIAKPAETSAPARAKFVAAARRAAQAVVSDHKGTPPPYPPPSPTLPPPAREGGLGRGAGERRVGAGKPGRHAAQNFLHGTLFAWLRPRTKSLALAVSTALLMFGAFFLALDSFRAPAVQEQVQLTTPTDDIAERGGESEQLPPDQPPPSRGAKVASATTHIPDNANALPDETALGQVPGRAVSPGMAAPAAIPTSAAAQTPAPPPNPLPQAREGAASSPMRDVLSQGTAGRDPASRYASLPVSDLTAMPLPPTIGGKALLAAASAGDPSACFEIATRFAQGRNTTQDLAMAAAWLERAARGGLAPAQFRLGSMYEKGLGVKKDLAEAHRLYVAAADKGHAKAMHNLAVLYAAGLDGKPDYATAAQWFRRAGAYGIVDSQYNLAILYARGVGIERNLGESYKWFALAAKSGDKDAARKRDEVAARLDAKQLESAKLNAESFVTDPQPDEATAIKVPPGGWDQVAAATTKSKALVAPERVPGK